MSVIYEIKCENCYNELKYTVELDSAYDLCVKVEPCEACLEESKQEGREE